MKKVVFSLLMVAFLFSGRVLQGAKGDPCYLCKLRKISAKQVLSDQDKKDIRSICKSFVKSDIGEQLKKGKVKDDGSEWVVDMLGSGAMVGIVRRKSSRGVIYKSDQFTFWCTAGSLWGRMRVAIELQFIEPVSKKILEKVEGHAHATK